MGFVRVLHILLCLVFRCFAFLPIYIASSIYANIRPKSQWHQRATHIGADPSPLEAHFEIWVNANNFFISLSPSYTRQDCRSPGIWEQKHRRRTLSGCRRSSKAGWSHLLPPVWGWNDPWRRVFYLTLRCPSALAGFLLSEEGFCSTIRLSVTVVWYFETQQKIILGVCVTIRSLSVTLVCQVECLVRYWLTNEQARKARICFSYLQSETISHSLTRQG